MSDPEQLPPPMYFSYGQFMVFDKSVKLPASEWTETHFAQGFARRTNSICFRTLFEFGDADVSASRSTFVPRDDYVRVIAVPFHVESGTVVVGGPEEFDDERTLDLAPGHYRLVAAQAVAGEENEVVDLFFEAVSRPLRSSEILVADEDLDPPSPLLEHAEVPSP
jgi:hypothetical protein